MFGLAAGNNMQPASFAPNPSVNTGLKKWKISLNAYSFNDLLIKKQLSHAELLSFCAQTGFEAIDITGYYFSGYPNTPSDKELFEFKRKAHELGIAISGTGVRNEFSWEEDGPLEKEIDLVKRWVVVAAKLGAPVLRIFTAKQYSTGEARLKVMARIRQALDRCLPFAESQGIILGIQNHNDFLRTADECFTLIKPFNSPWLGLVIDTGNFIAQDPYREIEKAIALGVNWQVKEKLIEGGIQADMNLERLFRIIKSSNYRGYIPIETLGLADPLSQIPLFFRRVQAELDRPV